MDQVRVISADSHIVEPADFWTAHIDRRYLDRAPHAHTREKGTVMFIVDGDKPLGSVGAPSQAGLRFERPEDITFEGTWEEVRPGSFDPESRFEDMRRDGIAGEVIYPTLGARLYGVIDGDLLSACCRAGNDWLIERFARGYAQTFKPVGTLNVHDAPWSVKELERCVKAGLGGGMIPTYPGEDYPYHLKSYDALWAAAQALGAPLALHVAACCQGPGQRSIFTKDWKATDAAAYSSTQDYWVRRSVANMIFAGTFERFPGLRIVIVEHELSWAPYFLKQMDFHYKELSQTAPYRFRDGTLPSDFFRDQIYITFQEDKLGLQTLPAMIGTDTLMFGSDYPHAESTWPNSQRFLDDLLRDAGPDLKRKYVHDNVARLFKFT
jgi:predicted TIM-barrel fold metal-dependent hydrolase